MKSDVGFTPGKVSLPAGISVVQITAGDSHSVARDSNGKVYYWGTFRDGSGAVGLTHDGSIQKLPVPLAHDLNVKKIASGKYRSKNHTKTLLMCNIPGIKSNQHIL